MPKRRYPLNQRDNNAVPHSKRQRRYLTSTPSSSIVASAVCEPVRPPDVPETHATQTDQLWATVRSEAHCHAMPQSAAPTPTARGTEAYKEVLTALGVDLPQDVGIPGKPDDIYRIGDMALDPSLKYPGLQTTEQLLAQAARIEAGNRVHMNEATHQARLVSILFPFADIPNVKDEERRFVPCQTLELPTPFSMDNRFNSSLYSFVRPHKSRDAVHESELKNRADLSIMAYVNAISRTVRRELSADKPGIHHTFSSCAPFLSCEFKPEFTEPIQRQAEHQIAIASYVCLVDRQRIPRLASYHSDSDIRHYAYTICGSVVSIWQTCIKLEKRGRRTYATYPLSRLRRLDLGEHGDLEEFLNWHRAIVTWGLRKYVPAYATDLEAHLGRKDRKSLLDYRARTTIEVTDVVWEEEEVANQPEANPGIGQAEPPAPSQPTGTRGLQPAWGVAGAGRVLRSANTQLELLTQTNSDQHTGSKGNKQQPELPTQTNSDRHTGNKGNKQQPVEEHSGGPRPLHNQRRARRTRNTDAGN
ncbi:MAG: hypothetical protein M1813_009711 [Trichoglossum hirsutum]|jgi:hypothetical protein|nr:MAG: hypothetical protein M1813_009711 [Trichoglossum hirsutum]